MSDLPVLLKVMDVQTQKAFEFAADLVKQLITLSTGVIALTVTFAKDIVPPAARSADTYLFSAWVLFLLSIICGVWALMALTGTLDPPTTTTPKPKLSIQNANCRVPTGLQILLFLVGMGLTITYAIKVL